MKSNFKLVGVDCAVCAGKLEHAINKLPYIKSATLSFVDLKLYVETVDDFDKTEQELEDKQRRLAYLQQDTSGANATEILNL